MPDDVQMSFLQWLVNEDSARQENYRAYREYYDGDHDTQLTERQRAYLQVKMGEEFNTNYCPIVVDALTERLIVRSFEAGDQGEQLWDWWNQNRMDAGQRIAHLSAVRDGDAYLIVSWDNDQKRPVFTPELAYGGDVGVKLHYSKEKRGEVEFASRRWRMESGDNTGKVRRLNLYYPDRIEKYISNTDVSEGDWVPYEVPGEPWPVPWVGPNGPLGVPVVHFKNADQGYDFGISELKKVIPLQNALNKIVIDILAAADTTGFRIYYMIGDDPTGLQISPGSWIFTNRPPGGENGAAIGYMPGEDLGPLIDLKDSFVAEIARVTRTPMHYFQTSGMVPAEGTLKQQETGLLSRIEDRQVTFGNTWEDAMAIARRLANAFGNANLSEDEPISCQWRDAETRNEAELMQTLKAKSELGVPREQLWAEMGYDEDQIAELQTMIAAERAAGVTSLAGAFVEQMRQFDQGGNGA